jgi:prolyl 4-hydroxylase
LYCVVDVEEGGETDFPRLGIAVKPKRGRALLWPSTLNANPELQDPRTHHQAKPVIRGTKYAANSWIHLYNYAQPNLWGCTGSFDEL